MNELFALKTVDAIRELIKGQNAWDDAPIIWVHDYHLMLAANTIRYFCLETVVNIGLESH